MIYYSKFPEPLEVNEYINGKYHRNTLEGEWLSDNPEVKKVWFTGSLNSTPDAMAKLHIHVIMKSSHRFEQWVYPEKNSLAREKLIAAAENWILNLEK